MHKTIKEVLDAKTLEYFQKPSVAPKKAPSITKAKVVQVVDLLLDVEANNGYVAIAQEAGLTTAQVKEIHAAMKEKEAELTPVEEAEVA